MNSWEDKPSYPQVAYPLSDGSIPHFGHTTGSLSSYFRVPSHHLVGAAVKLPLLPLVEFSGMVSGPFPGEPWAPDTFRRRDRPSQTPPSGIVPLLGHGRLVRNSILQVVGPGSWLHGNYVTISLALHHPTCTMATLSPSTRLE